MYLIIHKLETKHEDLISVCFSLSLSVCFCVCLINFFLFFVLAYILWVLKFLEKIVGLFWRFIVQDLGCDISFPRLLKSICHTRRGSYYGEVTAYPWVGLMATRCWCLSLERDEMLASSPYGDIVHTLLALIVKVWESV